MTRLEEKRAAANTSRIRREKQLPWREREFVSYVDAETIVGRSRGWAANQVVAGALAAFWLPSGGPAVISVASLLQYLEGSQKVDAAATQREPRHLELVVNNP